MLFCFFASQQLQYNCTKRRENRITVKISFFLCLEMSSTMIIWEGSRFLDFSACCKIFCVPPSLRNYAASSIYLTKIVCWAERGGHSIVACKFQRGRQTRKDLCLRAFTLQCQKSLSKEKNSFWKVRKHHHGTGLGHWAFSVQEMRNIISS